jgi:hypothetical protein
VCGGKKKSEGKNKGDEGCKCVVRKNYVKRKRKN